MSPLAFAQIEISDDERAWTTPIPDLLRISDYDFDNQVRRLNEILKDYDLTPYEQSLIHHMLGSIYYEVDQTDQAITSFQNTIDAGGLLPSEVVELNINIGQLMIANGQFAEGAERLEKWIPSKKRGKPYYVELIMSAWIQADNYENALPWAEKWFESTANKERRHYETLNFLYKQLRMPSRQSEIIKEMVARWPEDPNLWEAWISRLQNSGREKEAFEVRKLAYHAGVLKSQQHIMALVISYDVYDLPFEGAQILEHEIMLGRVEESVDYLYRLARLYMEAREYERALVPFEKALNKSNRAYIRQEYVEALLKTGRHEEAADIIVKLDGSGYHEFMKMGVSFYDAAALLEARPQCYLPRAERLASPKAEKLRAALNSFQRVRSWSPDYDKAQKWVTFIELELENMEKRCDFELRSNNLCWVVLEDAEQARTLKKDEFVLAPEDQHCLIHKDAWERQRE